MCEVQSYGLLCCRVAVYLVLVQLELDHVVEGELGVGRVDRLDAARLAQQHTDTEQIRQGHLNRPSSV